MKKNYLNTLFLSALSLIFLSGSVIGCANPEPDKEFDDLITAPTYKEDSVSIHYYRENRDFDDWALWLWEFPDGGGKEYNFNGIDNYGAVAAYPLSLWSSSIKENGLGFIVKTKETWDAKDPDGDRVIKFKSYEKDSNGIYHVYLKSGDGNIYSSKNWEVVDSILKCEFINSLSIDLVTNNKFNKYILYRNGELFKEKKFDVGQTGARITFNENEKISFEDNYSIEVFFEKSGGNIINNVSIRELFKTDEFADKYNYDENDLGVSYAKEKSIFKVWSPISNKITLNIYNNGTPTSVSKTSGNDNVYKKLEMTKGENGVFSAVVKEDLAKKYYTYTVTNSFYQEKEIVDPYAKSCGINGLRGQIVDFSATNPEGWDKVKPIQYDRKELTVYETHISDITSSDTWSNNEIFKKDKYLFNGAAIEGTTYENNGVSVKTGFDHIKELGINALQLIPIYDQANDETKHQFNWGYNPLNYNCLEGSYSSNPEDGYLRINEFKKLIQKYNSANINIIMDVVYNHVSSALGSNFDVLMPGYYFRYNSEGKLSNGSGCGNETASELPMFRKFMIDSAKFWASEYKLGGFRFDLMGLHDLETMNLLTKKCKEINPNIAIYGEPWTGGTTTLSNSQSAKQSNGNKYLGYGQFNDQMRDALIKGGLNGPTEKGWVTNDSSINSGNTSLIKLGIAGTTYNSSGNIVDPNKTVNYVTCHDNYTLFDRIKAAGIEDEQKIKKMAMLANSIVFTSQGTTFMLAGEEFLRTKQGDNNSYQSSYKVNELDYSLKISNFDMFLNYQKLINFKKSVDGMHLNENVDHSINFTFNEDKNLISYDISDNKNGLKYKIIHSNGYDSDKVSTFDLNDYKLYLDTIDSEKVLNKNVKIEKYETLIAYKHI